MLTLGDLSASPLFWETFWPCLGFAATAVAFFSLLLSTARG